MKRFAGLAAGVVLLLAAADPTVCCAGFPFWSGSKAKSREALKQQPTESRPSQVRVVSHVQPIHEPPADAAAIPTFGAPRNEVLPTPSGLPTENAPLPGDGMHSASDDLAMRGVVNLQPAPLEATDLALPINLATALKLSDARPLIVNAAQASAWVAEAELQRAKVLWVPSFNAGGDYIRHDGYGPDFNLGINTPARPLNQNVNFLYSGIGITQNVAMTDAIFQPLAARQVLNSRRWDIQSAKNDALMMTANSYFNVHQYRGQYAGALDTVERGRKLVERLNTLSQDLIPRVEVNRAIRMLADMEQHAASARQNWRTSSADLTQVLRLDPRVVVVPQEHDHLQVTLFHPDRPLDELIPIGLENRPELESQQALVRSVTQRIRQEKGRLLMPSIMLNGFQTPYEMLQFGAQGIGQDGALNLWSLRNDLSPQAIWQYEGMGFGNMARIKEQRGEESRNIIELFKVQDAVAADVTRAQARLQSAAVRVVQADRSMHEALITFEGNYEGLAQTRRFGNVLVQVYRPQEAVIALEHLLQAYDQYFATVGDYNRAQFELFHAMGYPAKEVAALRPPGEAEPVDTSRPDYLPPVGVGPPPATR
ncbi:MAG TPA: TolC family protein [Pirellulales bacterium]|nr:TolC family protein [Pirellulales bacterium]